MIAELHRSFMFWSFLASLFVLFAWSSWFWSLQLVLI